MLRIHFHSDCSFFSGCENMLANFFNSEEFRRAHLVSFSYRQSKRYEQGIKQRLHRSLPIYPVAFPDLSELTNLPNGFSLFRKWMIMVPARLLLTGPVLMYQVFILLRLFRELRPDILHINNGGYPAALSARAAVIASKLAGIPKVLMVVNNMAVGYQRFSRWPDYPLDRLISRSVDIFVTGSKAAAARLGTVLNLPAHKIMAIHNGIVPRRATACVAVTRERLGLDDFEGVIFGVVALLIPRKGHGILLEAISKLVDEKKINEKGLKILIEGEGPLLQELVEFAANHNLSDWVVFVGNEENIVDFMTAIDVLILPSVQDEDLPNVVLEAMSLGKPVISTSLAGIPEQVVHDVSGLLVEPRNVVQLAEAICYLKDNPNVRYEMGLAALERFNGYFTGKLALSNYENMYLKLFGDKK
jgi:glycosyltransferase involved in cell wall biosynthesis